MFGSKQRTIDELTAQIGGMKKELRELWQSVVDKNKKILAVNEALRDAERKNVELAQSMHAQAELILGLNAQLREKARILEQTDREVARAESAADAAIQAGGIISDQLRVAQAALAEKDAVIQELSQSNNEKSRNNVVLGVEVDGLKADKAKLTEELRQARAKQAETIDIAMDRYEAGVMPMPAQADADERKPGKPGTTTGRRPQGVPPKVAPPPAEPKATPPLVSGGRVKPTFDEAAQETNP